MKKMQALLFATLLATQVAQAAAVCEKDGDDLNCGIGIVENINHLGNVTLDGTTVSNKFKAVGDVIAANANLNRLSIIGDTEVKNSKAKGDVYIVGDVKANHVTFADTTKLVGDIICSQCNFEAKSSLIGSIDIQHSKFTQDLVIATRESSFASTTLQNISVTKQSEHHEEIIQLKDNSSVNNINFASGNGIVMVSGGSQITGKVTGGKVQYK